MKDTKTTVYLDEPAYQRIKLLARREGRPAAALIREAVTEYADRHGAAVGRPRSLGVAASGRGDLGERAEELLDDLGR